VRQLSAGLAHNLNNVMAAVLSCATVEESASREELLSALAEIRRATLRGREVTSHLGALSRREPLRARRFDVLATLAEVAALAQRSFLATTELVLEVPAGHCFFEGDPSEWHQVFLNLAINARDAMKSTGRLTLAAEVDASGLRVRVEDTGHGMPPEVLERVFEPFFTTKPPGEGTGLGLSYVDAVARAHGVALACRSSPAQGTCFTFTFRGVSLEASSAAPAPPERAAKLAARVLFVDDDEMVRRSTQRVLRRLGAEVTMAPSGEAALATLETSPSDVVLSDLSMPGMSGLELSRVLSVKHPRLPVVIVTGDLPDEQRRALNQLGVTVFVNKPFEDAELRAAIERALGRSKPPGATG
jgi:CheY-like chemotaxis protein